METERHGVAAIELLNLVLEQLVQRDIATEEEVRTMINTARCQLKLKGKPAASQVMAALLAFRKIDDPPEN